MSMLRKQKISSGGAAELLGMDRIGMIEEAAKRIQVMGY